jgi:hypothetical protein
MKRGLRIVLVAVNLLFLTAALTQIVWDPFPSQQDCDFVQEIAEENPFDELTREECESSPATEVALRRFEASIPIRLLVSLWIFIDAAFIGVWWIQRSPRE